MKFNHARVAGLLVAVVALCFVAAPSPAAASTATQWNEIAANALINNIAAPRNAPPVAAIHLAMVHGAMYDAVNAIDGGYTPYLSSPAATPFDSQAAAAATAAYDVLLNISSGLQGVIQPAYDATLNGIPNGMAKTQGIAIGHAAATAMINARAGDGRYGAPGFPVPANPQPGEWRPVLPAFVNDPNGWVRFVTPFVIEHASDFRTKGPHSMTSPQYTAEFNEVKLLGASDSTRRTQSQTNVSMYWGNANPVGTWNRITRMMDNRLGLSNADAARLYAELNMSAADAFIAVWDDKAFWGFWRPITAIREALSDGNPDTAPRGDWLPLLPTPPYPDHPSGHLGLDGAVVETLQEWFGDKEGWTDTAAGQTVSYNRFSDALNELVSVRVWSGLHFRNADEQAAKLGKEVAKWRKHHWFKKAH